MHTIFGCDWQRLTLEAIAGFLATADSEGLQWEAKGSRLDEHAIRKTVCAFANSHDGGYLILGASGGDDGRLLLDGIEFPDEPALWIASVVRDGLRPAPGIDVRAFPVEEGRKVAVVWTPPLSAPPCICRGTVYERVPGASPVVKDSARLAELYQRGETAHTQAIAAATAMSRTLLLGLPCRPDAPNVFGFTLAVATAGYSEQSLDGRVFSEAFVSSAEEALLALPNNDPPVLTARVERADWKQHSITLQRNAHHRLSCVWALCAAANGAVGLSWHERNSGGAVDTLVDPLRSAWLTAVQLVQHLGRLSSQHLTMRMFGQRFVGDAEHLPPLELLERPPVLTRGPLPLEVEETQLSSIVREIRRTLGDASYEP